MSMNEKSHSSITTTRKRTRPHLEDTSTASNPMAMQRKETSASASESKEEHQSSTTKTTSDLKSESSLRVSMNLGKNKSRNRKNSELTEEEKRAKRILKKKVKLQSKVKSLHNRIRHAQSRKDPIIEEQARKDLKLLIQKHELDIREMNLDVSFALETLDSAFTGTHDGDNVNMNASRKQETITATTQMQIIKEQARLLILQVSNVLFQQAAKHALHTASTVVRDNNDKDQDRAEAMAAITTKQAQTNNAVKLLKHMTKGTQNLDMFRDKNALWGYTRQKFYERALLLCTSLGKVKMFGSGHGHVHTQSLEKLPSSELQKEDPIDRYGSECTNEHNDDDAVVWKKQTLVLERAWKIFQQNRVRKAVSIGCGPGNDAVGLISFLRMVSNLDPIHATGTHTPIDTAGGVKSNSTSASISKFNHRASDGVHISMPLDEILLVDWSIQEWKDAVIDPLVNILKHDRLVKAGDGGVKTLYGDVTKDLRDDSNDALFRSLLSCDTDNCRNAEESKSDFDMYLISYLLSETRGKWESFFDTLVNLSKSGSMFYFAEPIPWQLHRFVELFEDRMDFVWVDSSIQHPALQRADRRAGPAVLFAMKR